MGKAEWWVGSADSVEDDALYEFGPYADRESAVAIGMTEFAPCDFFWVILAEADHDATEAEDYDPDYNIPFIAASAPEKVFVTPTKGTPDAQ